jgi:uncharacterized protein
MPTFEQASSWYPSGDPVHGLEHIQRVYRIAERIAQEEGADIEIVRAAALLHDLDSSLTASTSQANHNLRQQHQLTSAGLAGQILQTEGWSQERIAAVQHCIRSHRFRQQNEPPQTIEAKVLYDADKLDAIGATGFARAVAYAVQAKQPFYTRPSEQFSATGQSEPGEPHSAYHEYIFKLRNIEERLFTATARRLAQSRSRVMRTAFEQLAAEMEGDT